MIFSILHFFSDLWYYVYSPLWFTAKYVKRKSKFLAAAPRNLQLVGLNLLTSNLQVEKLLSPLVELQ